MKNARWDTFSKEASFTKNLDFMIFGYFFIDNIGNSSTAGFLVRVTKAWTIKSACGHIYIIQGSSSRKQQKGGFDIWWWHIRSNSYDQTRNASEEIVLQEKLQNVSELHLILYVQNELTFELWLFTADNSFLKCLHLLDRKLKSQQFCKQSTLILGAKNYTLE